LSWTQTATEKEKFVISQNVTQSQKLAAAAGISQNAEAFYTNVTAAAAAAAMLKY